MRNEYKDYINNQINDLFNALQEIQKLLGSDDLLNWSKALHLADLNGFDELRSTIKDEIVKHFSEFLKNLELDMPLYDMIGNYNDPFNINYKDETIAHFYPDSTVFHIVDKEEQISVYKHMQEVTKRDNSSKIKKQQEAAPFLELLIEHMTKLGYEIMKV